MILCRRIKKNVEHTDAIIKQTKWNSIVYTFFSELVDKHSESQALKLFSKELFLHFDEVQTLDPVNGLILFQ